MDDQSMEMAPEVFDIWRLRGSCVDTPPKVFFPDNARGVAAAKQICQGCVVQQVCLEYALEERQDNGVWGGTSERQRKKILRDRRQQ